ncbi:MAG TPA: hypothetical protein VGC15_20480 [Acetobacteraceae bacterium]
MKFTPDRGEMISDDVTEAQAATFAAIPGFRIVGTKKPPDTPPTPAATPEPPAAPAAPASPPAAAATPPAPPPAAAAAPPAPPAQPAPAKAVAKEK